MLKYGIMAALLLISQACGAAEPLKVRITTTKGPVPLTLELAVTPATREHGLMARKNLAPNDGMLFVFPRETHMAFWMKNTLIPLDMLFIDAKGNIVHVATGTVPLSLDAIDSVKPTKAVIEISGARAAKLGIQAGDHVDYVLPEAVHVE